MRIDVVSEVVCPWCFIGKRQLNPALPPERVARDDYLRCQFGSAGIDGVPFLVINGRVVVNGALGEEALLRAFERAASLPEAPLALRA